MSVSWQIVTLETTAFAGGAIPRSDFADWLSPILVKELRQGLRARGFVSTFLLLQAVMMVTVILGLFAGAGGVDPEAATGFFWLFVSLPLLIVVPLMAFNSLSGEIKANTLELIFLTRLTAWKIVAGKWLAHVAQSALFVCAILPYTVLRYFSGGINLVEELTTLGWLFAGSALLTGIGAGISPYTSRWVRALLVIGVLVMFQGLRIYLLMVGTVTFSSSSGGLGAAYTIAVCALALVLLLLMFETGAGKIAPPAENHSTRKRLLGLALLLIAAAAAWQRNDSAAIVMPALMLAVLVCAGALCEPPRWISSIYAPFAKRGAAGRAAGRFLYPGWSAGLLFVILTGFGAVLWWLDEFDDAEGLFNYGALCGALLFSAALVRLLVKNEEKAFPLFVALQIASLAVFIVCAVLQNALKWETAPLVAAIPTAGLFSTVFGGLNMDAASGAGYLGYLTICGFVTAASLLYLLYRSIEQWRKMHAAEQESLLLNPPNGTLA